MYLFIETICIDNGRACNVAYHTARFNRTRAVFWSDLVPVDLADVLSPPALSGMQKCRIVYGKHIKEVTYTPYEMRKVETLRLVEGTTLDYTHKHVDRDGLNALFAQRNGTDEVLILKQGFLTDTSIANVALWDGTRWVTPREPLLRGTKRAELLDKHLIVEKEIHVSQLGAYSRLMLFNALIDWKKMILPIDENRLVF